MYISGMYIWGFLVETLEPVGPVFKTWTIHSIENSKTSTSVGSSKKKLLSYFIYVVSVNHYKSQGFSYYALLMNI